MVVPNRFSFSMERRKEVCEDKVEDDSAVNKDYRWESDRCDDVAEYACVGFRMVDVTIESANLVWEEMSIGLFEDGGFGLPFGVVVCVIDSNKDGGRTSSFCFWVVAAIASKD